MNRALGRLLCVSLALVSMPVASAWARREARPAPTARGDDGARYMGQHPIAARHGGGFCYIDVPHQHAYAPDRPLLYQQVGDSYVFTGDPVPFGYDGPRTVFYGHHPVPVPTFGPFSPKPVFCMLRGPHYHDYPAPTTPEYETRDNVVFYVGAVAPEWSRMRPQVERDLDAEYRPFVALRPQVTVAPPPAWHGEVWVAPPDVQVVVPPPPSVQVAAPVAPSVQVVAPPPPSVQVVAPAPPSVHIVAPPPPSVHIVAPAPPRVHVVAPPPPSVLIAPPSVHIVAPGVHVVGPGHPGKHKGWFKGGKHGHW